MISPAVLNITADLKQVDERTPDAIGCTESVSYGEPIQTPGYITEVSYSELQGGNTVNVNTYLLYINYRPGLNPDKTWVVGIEDELYNIVKVDTVRGSHIELTLTKVENK